MEEDEYHKKKRRRPDSSEEDHSSDSSTSSGTKKVSVYPGVFFFDYICKKRRKAKRSKKESSKKKRKKEKKKKKKKRKKASQDGAIGAIDQSLYGSKGIKRREDIHNMRDEFEAWLREVKNIPEPPSGNRETMELFDIFCEDYNTVTLPEKYYNLAEWEYKQREKAAKKEAKRLAKATGKIDLSKDERYLEEQKRIQKKREEISKLHASLVSVNKEKADAMREQDLLRRRIKFLYDTGEIEEARRLQEKLRSKSDPDRERAIAQEEDPF